MLVIEKAVGYLEKIEDDFDPGKWLKGMIVCGRALGVKELDMEIGSFDKMKLLREHILKIKEIGMDINIYERDDINIISMNLE